MKFRYIFIQILIIIYSTSNIVYSQETFDPDSLFKNAISQSKAKDYDKAINTCKQILERYPNYNDVRTYLGTIYSWNNRYDEARAEFKSVLDRDADDRDATIAAINNELWSDNYETALKITNDWLAKKNNDIDVIFVKIKILEHFEKYKEAIDETIKILTIESDNKKAIIKKKDLKLQNAKNSIGLTYNVDAYKDNTPHHLFYADYSRKTPLGSVIGRVNYAERFGNKGYQFEADAYPRYFKNTYGYVNFGYSEAAGLFPKYRYGFDVYHNFPKALEASLGIRYLIFSSSEVAIYTGHFGKYLGNYWLSLRPFITPGNTGTSFSGIFQIRRYFSSSKDYMGLSFGLGSSPDDKRKYFDTVSNLASNKIKLEYNKPFATFWIFNINAAYENEEYFPSKFRDIYSVGIGIQKLF